MSRFLVRVAFQFPVVLLIMIVAPYWWACAAIFAANLIGYAEGRVFARA